MMSVNSARQLCKMFFSLHVVFLSVAMVESSASNGNQEDCMRSSGVEYRGEKQSSSSGLICLNWANTTRDYDDNIHPDSQTGVGDHNYCRNPDSSERPWCYIAGPDGTVQRQFCAVDTCKAKPSHRHSNKAQSHVRKFSFHEKTTPRPELIGGEEQSYLRDGL
ncbi:Phosphoinositide-3-kinase-interacting protein 1 [Collichthys lucidus]|uniref:Phosphoinositide-3-kinase-interacting protein 1 n=1 Tax=Collichthys lucidus TaxID=240159 RepID=A0A4U5UU22_COLLU|nr:Phosphoinositide-3-kinase-interacting protein 1 [Collichthys lucidus]